MKPRLSRRAWIASGAAAPFVWQMPLRGSTAPGQPPCTLSINIEIMFPREMPRPKRMEIVADQGFKAYSFWNTSEEAQDEMLKAQERTGLKCASITGPGRTFSTTGLTKPGMEQAYLEEITARVKMATRFGGPQPIIFVGRT
jgi:hydroxypyruvate isomerase